MPLSSDLESSQPNLPKFQTPSAPQNLFNKKGCETVEDLDLTDHVLVHHCADVTKVLFGTSQKVNKPKGFHFNCTRVRHASSKEADKAQMLARVDLWVRWPASKSTIQALLRQDLAQANVW